MNQRQPKRWLTARTRPKILSNPIIAMLILSLLKVFLIVCEALPSLKSLKSLRTRNSRDKRENLTSLNSFETRPLPDDSLSVPAIFVKMISKGILEYK